MDNIKNDEYYISKIKENLNFIVKHMENTERNDFDKNLQKNIGQTIVIFLGMIFSVCGIELYMIMVMLILVFCLIP